MAAIYLPNLVQRIVLDPSGLKKGAAASKAAMAPVQKSMAVGSASAMAMGGSLNTLGFRAQTTGRMLLKYIAAPVALIGGLSIKAFTEFEASMTKIEALVGVSAGAVRGFTADVKAISAETARAPQELADATFFIASAGLRGATATDVLNASAKAAAVGLGETKVVADAATSAVNAYGAENLSGSMAVDTLTAAVREGKVEANQLAPAIGKAIPVASAMGIEFHEVAAAIASMTRTGTDARTSAIQLRQIMQSLLDPSRQTVTALKEMGVAEGELRDMARSEGLLAVLVKLRDLASENADAFADVFPNIRALAGALDITGPNLKENEQIFAALANSAGDTDRAFKVTAETAKFKLASATTAVKNSFVQLGESLVPIIESLAKVIKGFASLLNLIAGSGPLGAFIITLGGLAAILGTLLVIGGNVAASLAFKASMMEFLTVSTGKNTASTALNSVAQRGQAVALQATSAAANAAAVSMRILSVATKATLLIGVISAFAALVYWAGIFGRKTRTTAEEVKDLAASLKEVRSMGDRVITPIGASVGALVIRAENVDRGEILNMVGAFKSAYDENLQTAFDELGTGQGALAVEDALTRAFKGAGDSPEIREAIRLLLEEYNAQVGLEDGAIFERLFGDAFSGDAFAAFLKGGVAGGEEAIRIDSQLSIDRVSGSLNKLKELMAAYGAAKADMYADLHPDYEESGEPPPDSQELIEASADLGRFVADLEEANPFEGIGDSLGEFLRKGEATAFAMQISAIADILGSIEDAPDGMLDQVNRLLVGGIGYLEAYTEAGDDLFDVLYKISQSSVDEVMDLLGSGGGATHRLAQAVAEELALFDWNEATIEIPIELRSDGLADMTDEEKNVLALQRAVARLTAESEELANTSDGIYTVADAISDMDTAFARADATAKRFNKQFDDFIGRTMELDDANSDFMGGQQDLADSILESGGAMDMFSEKGRDARDAMKDQVRGAQEMATAMLENKFSMEEAEARFTSFIGAITQTALANGATAEDIAALFAEIGLDLEDMRLSFTSEESAAETEASSALQDSVQKMVDGVLPFTQAKGGEIAEGVILGVTTGLRNGQPELDAATQVIFTNMVDEALFVLGIKSPSKVFAVSVGQPITAGIAKGILDGKKNLKNVIREVVDDAIDVAQTAVSAASRSITAVLDFGDAERALDRLKQKAGGKGVDTRFEKLNQKKLERAVEEAKRNLRLGKGNQEDLELALMEAEFNLEDFQTAADTGDEVTRAKLDLADAGLEVANAEAQMRMEGEKAIKAFKSLGDAVGLTGDELNDLLDIRGDGNSLVERIFDKDTLDAIAAVGNGQGWIYGGGGGGGPRSKPIVPEPEVPYARDPMAVLINGIPGFINEAVRAANRWGTPAAAATDFGGPGDQTAFNDAISNITNNIVINALPSEIASTVVAAIDGTTTEGVRTKPPATDPSKRGGQ